MSECATCQLLRTARPTIWPALAFPGIDVPYKLYKLYDWGKVPELYNEHGTLPILRSAGQSCRHCIAGLAALNTFPH